MFTAILQLLYNFDVLDECAIFEWYESKTWRTITDEADLALKNQVRGSESGSRAIPTSWL